MKIVGLCADTTKITNKTIDNQKQMIYVKHVSLIQSGGVIRDEEATATPETEGADLSDTQIKLSSNKKI